MIWDNQTRAWQFPPSRSALAASGDASDCRPGETVLIAENDPRRFVEGLFTALASGSPVFLANPHWSPRRCAEAAALIKPHRVIGNAADFPPIRKAKIGESSNRPMLRDLPSGSIAVPTGGTTGGLTYAVHTVATLRAAAEAFCAFFGAASADACCTLPLFHVSGLMQVMRAYFAGGKVVFRDWKEAPQTVQPEPGRCFLSLVPTQLAGMLDQPGSAAWLRGFRAILLGGAAADNELLARARGVGVPLAPCYGMTETAALITARKSAAFLAGADGVGQPLPHASVNIVDESGGVMPWGQVGRVVVSARSLCLGKIAADSEGFVPFPSKFSTGDLGRLDASGCLFLTGRADRLINSGGEKIDPAVVEAALCELPGVTGAHVLGHLDERWGQRVAAVIVHAGDPMDVASLRQALAGKLAPCEIPREVRYVSVIPRTLAGKIDTEAVRALF